MKEIKLLTKHSVKQKQLLKRFKVVDGTIGRMIFFDENFETAVKKVREKLKID